MSDSSEFCVKVSSKKFLLLLFREVPANFSGPHLIFTNMGDDQTPAYSCASYVGMRSGPGQVVNLGAPECLSIGGVLHETLHALGFKMSM